MVLSDSLKYALQSKDTVYLESVGIEEIDGGLEKQTVIRIDLAFINDDEGHNNNILKKKINKYSQITQP